MSTAPPVEDVPPAPAHGDEASHSGRLLLRMPQSLHAELAREAEREGVSLNGFITGALASAVSWRTGQQRSATAPRSRLLRTAIAVDLVLVAIAAVLSVALLIAAWP